MDSVENPNLPLVISILVSYLQMMRNLIVFIFYLVNLNKKRKIEWGGEHALDRHLTRQVYLHKIIYNSDLASIENICMNRRSFALLCNLLSTTGKLEGTKNTSLEEMVASFLHIVAHNVKNRVIKRQLARSGGTISRNFSRVLNAILRCHQVLLKKLEPVPANSSDTKWKWFEVYWTKPHYS